MKRDVPYRKTINWRYLNESRAAKFNNTISLIKKRN